MKNTMMEILEKQISLLLITIALVVMGCNSEPKFTEETKEGFNLIKNKDEQL